MTWPGIRSQNSAIGPAPNESPGRVVGVADDQQLRRRRHLGQHRLEVVDVAVGQRHADLPRAGERRHVRVDREGGPGVDDLGTGLTERRGGGEEDLAGAVAERDVPGLHLVALGQAAAQQGRGGVGVAVHRRCRPLDRLDHRRVGRERGFVGGELRHLAGGDLLGRLAGGHSRLIAGDPGQLLGEGDAHRRPIVPRPGPSAAPARHRDRCGRAGDRRRRSSAPSP